MKGKSATSEDVIAVVGQQERKEERKNLICKHAKETQDNKHH
jgi:hypothetical protein